MINVADPADVDATRHRELRRRRPDADRFLFRPVSCPTRTTQYGAYRKVLEWAGGKPVTIRTLDAGGDKPMPGFTAGGGNPFLGLRGLRLSLAPPGASSAVQLRALLRAAVLGPSQGHVADGDACRTSSLGPLRSFADERREAGRMRRAHAIAAARHHGRGAGGGDRA